jgi:hypothetical protein
MRRFREETDLIAYGCFTDVVNGAGITFCRDGDQAASDSTSYDGDIALLKKDIPPCVEIMIGTRFPSTFVDRGKEWMFDGLRKTRRRYSTAVYLSWGELGSFRLRSQCFQTLVDDAPEGTSQRTILGYRKDKRCNRSMSWPLASLGINDSAVLRIAILSTGEELVSLSVVTKEHLVKDANGPFLETALRNFWRVISDDGGSFVELVSNKASTRERGRPHQHRQVRFVEAGLD